MASMELLLSFIMCLSVAVSAAVSQPPLAPPQSIVNAADTLARSGYTAMSLTLQIIAPTLPLPSSSSLTALTIFSPPDASFFVAGQPSLAHLLLHFSPLSLSLSSLLSLPFASTIPTLSPSRRLVITSNRSRNISINNVRVSGFPIFDDEFVVVYAIADFFDLNFTLGSTNSTAPKPKSDFQCQKLESASRFDDASSVLKLRGHAIIGAFLDFQILGYLHSGSCSEDVRIKWTIFAPADEALVRYGEDFLQYYSLFLRHLVPCKIGLGDLEEMKNGTVVSNNVNGFSLEITRDEHGELLLVNGVEILFPEMFDNEWLVIHGIRDVIPLTQSLEEGMQPAVKKLSVLSPKSRGFDRA